MTNLKKTQKLSEIVEVKELLRTNDVNAHIKLGWKLIDTYKSSSSAKEEVIKYCVGWPKSAGNLEKSATVVGQKKSTNSREFIYSI